MMEMGSKSKVLVTGGTSGLGLEMVKLFLDDGAEVFATGRNTPGSLIDNSRFHFIKVDFSDLRQVAGVFSELASSQVGFDLVVNNAGILSPHDYKMTKDGFEYTFQVNFLSHLLIGDLIVRSLRKGRQVRLAYITSPVYKYVKPVFNFPEEQEFRPFRTYCRTKYYLLFIGSYLKSKYPEKDIQSFALDPGIFSSGIYRMKKRWFHIMYMAGALFMRSSQKVAFILHTILTDKGLPENRIYKHSGRRSHPIPEMNDASEKFLVACDEALKLLL